MPRLPSTSWAPRPTRASRTSVFTGRDSGSQDPPARGMAQHGGGRNEGRGQARRSAAGTATGADAQQVDVDPPHEEHRRHRHGPMSTSPIDLCNATSHTPGRRGSYGSRTSLRMVAQDTRPPATKSPAQTIMAMRNP